jgi:alkylation response protein AidB-like acyl-CoA dehydrogenase
LATRAHVRGDEVVLNGIKRWCSGAGHAEQYLVYARLGDGSAARGIGAVLVDRDAPGLSFGPPERLMGFRGIPSADILLQDVAVPVENIIVPAGGFSRLFGVFSIERLGNATMSLAVAQTALDRSAAYVKERCQFGRPIAQFQMVQASLAEMIVQVEGARQLVYQVAREAGRSVPSALSASIAKYAANTAAKAVSDAALQLHGGYGYSEEYDIERLCRDAQGWALAGGTLNMQKLRIASEYLEMRFNQRAG